MAQNCPAVKQGKSGRKIKRMLNKILPFQRKSSGFGERNINKVIIKGNLLQLFRKRKIIYMNSFYFTTVFMTATMFLAPVLYKGQTRIVLMGIDTTRNTASVMNRNTGMMGYVINSFPRTIITTIINNIVTCSGKNE